MEILNIIDTVKNGMKVEGENLQTLLWEIYDKEDDVHEAWEKLGTILNECMVKSRRKNKFIDHVNEVREVITRFVELPNGLIVIREDYTGQFLFTDIIKAEEYYEEERE